MIIDFPRQRDFRKGSLKTRSILSLYKHAGRGQRRSWLDHREQLKYSLLVIPMNLQNSRCVAAVRMAASRANIVGLANQRQSYAMTRYLEQCGRVVELQRVHPRARYNCSSTYLDLRVLRYTAGMWRELDEPRSSGVQVSQPIGLFLTMYCGSGVSIHVVWSQDFEQLVVFS